MSSATNYARRFARLRARIFGEVVRTTNAKQYKVVSHFAEKPILKDLPKWYPPIDKFNTLLHRLRNLGLFRDEHLNLAEKLREHRIARGKVTPKKGLVF
uniref:Small ribosomal subunit protein mS33 n=1 Tax=Amphimedon queenslandica TaxID=400682 RepID=A0A1X7V9V3_AMPQE